MTIPEILQKFAHQDNKFPRTALEAAIAQKEEITPHLLEIIDRTATAPNDALANNDFSFLYALYLLGQFREQRAYPLIIKLVSLDPKIVDELLGDTITEGLARILASVYNGDLASLKALGENNKAEEFVRGAAFDAIAILALYDVLPRAEVMSYFGELLTSKLENEESSLLASLISIATDLYPEEIYEPIKQAFTDERVDEMFIGLEEVEEEIAKGKDECLRYARENPHHQLIESAIKEMEWWAWYNEPSKPLSRLLDTPRVPALGDGGTYVAPPKVGRNDPCPCGSGKKYKKCCGA